MGDGRVRSDKVMLPESMMADEAALRGWIARAFNAASVLPKKEAGEAGKKVASKKTKAPERPTAKRARRSDRCVGMKCVREPSPGNLTRLVLRALPLAYFRAVARSFC